MSTPGYLPFDEYCRGCTMSATECDETIEGADGSQIIKIGYLRRLKDWLNDDRSSRVRSLKEFVVVRLRCRPNHCKCRQRRFVSRFVCPLESEQTMKKKFFVLRAESATNPACLEYYENEKKWRSGAQPKRSIVLKSCFNINRKLDVKQKHALALYTKDDCFTMVLDSEEELESWLNSLLALQQDDEQIANDEPPKPTFEHVWQVNVRNRGLANTKNIVGAHHLCLTSQTLSLVKLSTNQPQPIEFPLMSIRRCGHSYCFFFMELGRSAVTGSGELWMQTEDVVIARNMHETILNAMRFSSKDDVTPRQRTRSISSTESSKPINAHSRRVGTVLPPVGVVNSPSKRERSDSVPSRPRTISDGPMNGGRKSQPWNFDHQRPHSMYAHASSYSPPTDSLLLDSPNSMRRGTDSGESCLSIDENESNQYDVISHKNWLLSSPADNLMEQRSSITEEGANPDYLPMSPSDNNNCKTEDKFSLENADLHRVLSNKRRSQNCALNGKVSTGQKNVNDYMDMAPSSTNSPSESEGYMAMSPVGSFMADTQSVKSLTPVKSYLSSPIGSQPTSSIGKSESNASSYVPMAPLSCSAKSITPDSDGYLDMKPTNQDTKNEAYLDMSSTSKVGTPVDSMRFSEFQMDKVRTYFVENETEDDKLVRAYSVGSKPQPSRDIVAHYNDDSASRVRAFSVGSKSTQFRSGENPTVRNTSDVLSGSCNKKSYSAPMLTGSASSMGIAKTQNENLMEFDFAKNANRNCDSHPKNSFRTRTASRLVTTGRLESLQVIGEISQPTLPEMRTKNNYSDTSCESKERILGEYVNIDLKKVSNKHKNEPHEYANLHAGRLICSENQRRMPKECESPYENISYPTTSVTSTTTSTSSAGSDKELNYASLDLGSTVAIKNVEDDKSTPPHTPLDTNSDDSDKQRLSYARIDFTKSEGLRNTSHTVRKIRQNTA